MCGDLAWLICSGRRSRPRVGSTSSSVRSATLPATRPRCATIYRAVGEILRVPPSLPGPRDRRGRGIRRRADRRLPLPGRRAVPRLPHLDADRRPQEPGTPAGDAALSGRIVGDYGLKIHGPDRAGVRLPRPHRPPRRSFVKIRELFRGDIERPIETVIHVDLSDEAIVAHEIDEYVVTENIREHLEELADALRRDRAQPERVHQRLGERILRLRQEHLRQDRRLRPGQSRSSRVARRPSGSSLGPTRTSLKPYSTPPTRWRQRSRCSSTWPAVETCCAKARASCCRCIERCSSGSATRPTNCWPSSRSRSRRRVGSRPSRRRCWKRPTGEPWAQVRDVALAKNYASRALHLIDPANFPNADSWAKAATRAEHRPQLARRPRPRAARATRRRREAPRLRRRRGRPVRRPKHPAHVRPPGPGRGVPEEARPALARGHLAGEAERRRRQPRVAPGRVRPRPGPLPAAR